MEKRRYLPWLYHRGTVRLKRQCFKWKLQISMKKVKSRFLSESHVGWAQFDQFSHWWNWHKANNPEETKWLACVNSSNIISPAIPSGMKEHHLDFSVTASKSARGSKTGFKGLVYGKHNWLMLLISECKCVCLCKGKEDEWRAETKEPISSVNLSVNLQQWGLSLLGRQSS